MKLLGKKKYLIFGVKHKLIYFNNSHRQDVAMGKSDCKDCVIRLCNDMPTEMQEQTLLHEVVHLIDMNLSLKFTEEQVNALATGLYSFIKENKL